MGYCVAIRNKVLMYATMWMQFEYINYEKTKHKSHISQDTISSKYRLGTYTEISSILVVAWKKTGV